MGYGMPSTMIDEARENHHHSIQYYTMITSLKMRKGGLTMKSIYQQARRRYIIIFSVMCITMLFVFEEYKSWADSCNKPAVERTYDSHPIKQPVEGHDPGDASVIEGNQERIRDDSNSRGHDMQVDKQSEIFGEPKRTEVQSFSDRLKALGTAEQDDVDTPTQPMEQEDDGDARPYEQEDDGD